MATGDVTAVNYGTYGISSAELLTTLGTINLGAKVLSGGVLFLLPTGYNNSQVQVIKVLPAGY